MKTIFTFLLICIAMFSTAQKTIEVVTVEESISKGNQPGFAVEIPQASLDNVKKAWESRIQKGTKSKAVEVGYEVLITGAIEKEISPNSFNIYSLLLNKDSLVYLIAFFEIDSSQFFDPKINKNDIVNQKVDLAIRDYMHSFAVEQYTLAVQQELKAEEKILKELNRELKSLKDDEEKNEKNIKSCEQKITTAEEETEMLHNQTLSQMNLIESAHLSLIGITDKDAKKAANKELNSLEKGKKKLDGEKEKQQKHIVGYQSDIKDSNSKIEKLQESQQEVAEKISAQEGKVTTVKEKLSGIR